jgi:hypothetical protein
VGRWREAIYIEELVLEHNFVSRIFFTMYACMYVLCTIGFLQTV